MNARCGYTYADILYHVLVELAENAEPEENAEKRVEICARLILRYNGLWGTWACILTFYILRECRPGGPGGDLVHICALMKY